MKYCAPYGKGEGGRMGRRNYVKRIHALYVGERIEKHRSSLNNDEKYLWTKDR